MSDKERKLASESKGAPALTVCKHCGLKIYMDEASVFFPTQTQWHHHGSNLRECYITFAEPEIIAAHCQAPAPAGLSTKLSNEAAQRLVSEMIAFLKNGGWNSETEAIDDQIAEWLVNAEFPKRADRADAEAATPQGTPPSDPVRLLLIRAITEMSYMHCAEVLSLVRSAEGEAIIEEGMKLIGLKDLSEEELARVRNGEVGNGKR